MGDEFKGRKLPVVGGTSGMGFDPLGPAGRPSKDHQPCA
jgi:hypothetical protein